MRRLPDPGADDGSAVVEFLGVALVLLVPVVYLVLVLAALQGAAFAVDGAAREAVRAVTAATPEQDAAQRAVAAVGIALADQGLDPALAPDAVVLTCEEAGCTAPGATVTATVEVQVPLPGVPSWLREAVPLVVPVSAQATGAVDEFRAGP